MNGAFELRAFRILQTLQSELFVCRWLNSKLNSPRSLDQVPTVNKSRMKIVLSRPQWLPITLTNYINLQWNLHDHRCRLKGGHGDCTADSNSNFLKELSEDPRLDQMGVIGILFKRRHCSASNLLTQRCNSVVKLQKHSQTLYTVLTINQCAFSFSAPDYPACRNVAETEWSYRILANKYIPKTDIDRGRVIFYSEGE